MGDQQGSVSVRQVYTCDSEVFEEEEDLKIFKINGLDNDRYFSLTFPCPRSSISLALFPTITNLNVFKVQVV